MIASFGRRLLRGAFLLPLFAGLTLAAPGCSAEEEVSGESDEVEDQAQIRTEDPATAPQARAALRFAEACSEGTRITIAAVGDVLLHKALQVQAYAAPDGARSLWSGFEARFAAADLAYANLEGPAADATATTGEAPDPGRVYDGRVYAGYPTFNYHPSLLSDLRGAGFDVVSTANNHTLDRGARGVDRTVANLEQGGLAFTGTRRAGDRTQPWYAITEAKGVRVAWLACTFSTNVFVDTQSQVLGCYDERRELLGTVRALSARADVDAVIVTPHWGDAEYTHHPAPKEKALARELIEAGATAILGAHPHVVQPWEKIVAQDGREGFVIYSLGNFVSTQTPLATRSAAIVYLGLTKAQGGKARVNGVRHEPFEMGARPWTLRRAGRDSAALTNRILGTWNAVGSGEPVVTNPECN